MMTRPPIQRRTLVFLALVGSVWLGPEAYGEPDPPAADRAALVRANTAFAVDLYTQLRGQDGNLFLSPYSISTALGMTWAGARGRTEANMGKALHFDSLGQAKLHKAFRDLLAAQNGGADRPYQLSVANALWGQKDFGFLDEFLRLTRDHYGAGLELVDFKADPEDARRTINRWVEEQTQDKIRDLLAKGVVNGTTRMVLTNAIYFKGKWTTEFKKENTRKAPFFLEADRSVQAPLMTQTARFRYGQVGSLQVLEMGYQGGDLSMVVLLPPAGGLSDLEAALTPDALSGWLSSLHSQRVRVFFPRFKATCSFALREALEGLGMGDAFAKVADFSGMTGNHLLKISAVIHKAFVDVNEEGTEAAAATAVVMGTKRSVSRPPPLFRADRPFLFMIRDNRSGSVLFMGRISDPTA